MRFPARELKFPWLWVWLLFLCSTSCSPYLIPNQQPFSGSAYPLPILRGLSMSLFSVALLLLNPQKLTSNLRSPLSISASSSSLKDGCEFFSFLFHSLLLPLPLCSTFLLSANWVFFNSFTLVP